MPYYYSKKAAGEIVYMFGLIVVIVASLPTLVNTVDALVALEEGDRTCEAQLKVELLDYALLEHNKVSLKNLDVPLIMDDANHATEAGSNGLLQLGGHKGAHDG